HNRKKNLVPVLEKSQKFQHRQQQIPVLKVNSKKIKIKVTADICSWHRSRRYRFIIPANKLLRKKKNNHSPPSPIRSHAFWG
ncbi:hypothetical protein, partial [Flavobacterium sp. 3-210]